MSKGTFQFTEAAKLYAEHAAVVEQMKELHRSNILAFADRLYEEMMPRVTDGGLKQEVQPAYRSWWIEDVGCEKDDVPYLYFRVKDAAIVVPGVLTVFVEAEGDLKPHRPLFAAAVKNLTLPANCSVSWQANGLPEVLISLNAQDPVASATEPVLTMLEALYRADKTRRAQASKSKSDRQRA